MKKKNFLSYWHHVFVSMSLITLLFFISPTPASAACTSSIKLLQGSTAVRGGTSGDVTTVNAVMADYAKYKLSVKVSGCTGTLSITYNRAGDVQGRDMQPEQNLSGQAYSQTFTFGQPAQDEYRYDVGVLAQVNGSWTTVTRKKLVVNWGDGKTASIDNSSGNATSATPPAAAPGSVASGGVTGKPNSQINSGVTVSTNQSFDTVLGTFSNPLEFSTIPELIIRLINIGLLLAAMIAVVVIIAGGFNLATAMGNETKITNGKRSIMWAIGGLVVCLLSFSIVAIIQKVIS